jgi:hypothetical protein
MNENLENQDAVETTENTVVNPFADESWADVPVNAEDETTQQQDSTTNNESQQTETEEDEEEIVDANEYLKQTLGFDDWEVAKTEIEKLKTQKANPKYENEFSEKIHKALVEGKHDDVYSYLENQFKINKLLSSDLDDKSAEEIVKLSMKSKYQDLTDEEISYKYRKQFALPKEPEQSYDETDEDFESRKQDWEDKVRDVKMELMIEAKTSKSQLEQLKADLKLPEISQEGQQAKSLTPEELEQAKAYVDTYLKSVDDTIKSFNGFTVDYKDEEVSLQSAYLPSEDEKKFVATQLKTFAENDFNANVIFADRWVNENGTLNTAKMTKDLALLYSEEKIMQKLVNDGVAKRLSEYRKSTSNIKIGSQPKGSFKPEGNSQNDMAQFFFGQ